MTYKSYHGFVPGMKVIVTDTKSNDYNKTAVLQNRYQPSEYYGQEKEAWDIKFDVSGKETAIYAKYLRILKIDNWAEVLK